MIFFDTETTGLPDTYVLNPKDPPRIVEVGAIKTDSKLRVKDRMSVLVYPGVKLPPESTKWYDITDTMLSGCPSFPAVLMRDIIPFFLGEETVVGYNVQFDLNILRWELQRIGMEFRFPWPHEAIDAIQYRNGKRISLDKWSLEVLGDSWNKQEHRALPDCERLLACYRSLE